jgi:hypothetical protein
VVVEDHLVAEVHLVVVEDHLVVEDVNSLI